MPPVCPGNHEFPKLMAHHVLCYIYRHMLTSVVYRYGMANEGRMYGRAAGPGLDDLFLVALVHGIYLFQNEREIF